MYGGGTKAKGKETSNKASPRSAEKFDDKLLNAINVGGHDHTPNLGTSSWPPPSRTDMRNPQTEIDLTRG